MSRCFVFCFGPKYDANNFFNKLKVTHEEMIRLIWATCCTLFVHLFHFHSSLSFLVWFSVKMIPLPHAMSVRKVKVKSFELILLIILYKGGSKIFAEFIISYC